jgi:hypothetical protein
MQLFNGVSLHREHYVNPKNLYMHRCKTHMHRNEPSILPKNIYMHPIEAYLLQ